MSHLSTQPQSQLISTSQSHLLETQFQEICTLKIVISIPISGMICVSDNLSSTKTLRTEILWNPDTGISPMFTLQLQGMMRVKILNFQEQMCLGSSELLQSKLPSMYISTMSPSPMTRMIGLAVLYLSLLTTQLFMLMDSISSILKEL